MSEKERGMSDIRERLVARQREEYGASWDVLVPEVGWTLGRIIESVIEDVLAEFDVTPRGEDQWWESLVEAPCDQGHRVFIDDGDGGVYACPVCRLSGERVKPSVEDVARVIEDVLCEHRIVHVETIHGTVYRCEHSECDYDTADWTAWEEHVAPHVERAVLALFPGRTETEVKAEAWGEGERAGLRRADFEYGHATIQAVKTNPYRKEADRG